MLWWEGGGGRLDKALNTVWCQIVGNLLINYDHLLSKLHGFIYTVEHGGPTVERAMMRMRSVESDSGQESNDDCSSPAHTNASCPLWTSEWCVVSWQLVGRLCSVQLPCVALMNLCQYCLLHSFHRCTQVWLSVICWYSL